MKATGLVVLSCLLAGGCGPGTAPPPAPQEVHLKQLAILYGKYTGRHQGQGPKSEDDFKAFIKKLPPADLAGADPNNIDALFTSPRDGQPYKVLYNVRMASPGPQGAPVIAYEQTGEGGRRYVADALGGVQELDEEAFAKRVPEAS